MYRIGNYQLCTYVKQKNIHQTTYDSHKLVWNSVSGIARIQTKILRLMSLNHLAFIKRRFKIFLLDAYSAVGIWTHFEDFITEIQLMSLLYTAFIKPTFWLKNFVPVWRNGNAFVKGARGAGFKSRRGHSWKKVLPCRISIQVFLGPLGSLLWGLEGHSSCS